MRTLRQTLVRLYPQAWRTRYGEELEALLEQVNPDRRVILDVFVEALQMQCRQNWKFVAAVPFVLTAVWFGSWWAGQRPRMTPGNHQVFYMDSTPGAMLEFLVLFVVMLAGIATLAEARRRWIPAVIAATYLTTVVLISLFTPRTIVNIGDSYCWDLWCVGIQNVEATPRRDAVLYTADVSIFADSSSPQHVPLEEAKRFFYVLDESGRRFPILQDLSLANGNVTVNPGESVRSSVAFLAPAGSKTLFLTGDMRAPLWVRLYFGSDLNPFHRSTLLRIL